jgi:hypothetical protein
VGQKQSGCRQVALLRWFSLRQSLSVYSGGLKETQSYPNNLQKYHEFLIFQALKITTCWLIFSAQILGPV